MRILFHLPGADAAPWLADLNRALPEAAVRIWQPGDKDGADYALVWKPPVELLQDRPGVKAVFNLGAGVDALVKLLRAHPGLLAPHVPIIKLDDAGMAAQMVQYVMHAVLRHFRRLDDYAAQQKQTKWQPLAPREQATHAIGVMGLGALGAQVADALAKAGFPVRGWSRSTHVQDGVVSFHGVAGLPDFLAGLRVLVNMLPLTADTENILNRDVFARLERGAQLINVARGAHVVDADLLSALDSGQLARATLDVFREEPLPAAHPFWTHPRVDITPHISALTLRSESVAQIAAKIRALENGQTVAGAIDSDRGY